MKISIELDPTKHSKDDFEKHSWQREFLDFNNEQDSWFKRLHTGAVFEKHQNNIDAHVSAKTCPAFINGFKNRILIRNIADLTVLNSKNKIDFYSNHPGGDHNHFHYHLHTQLGSDFPTPKGRLKDPIKFVSPFWLWFSETVDVIYNPVWWSQSLDLVEAVPGMIRIKKNTPIIPNINTFVKMPEFDGKYVIPKGTPLCQLLIVEVKRTSIHFVKSMPAKKSNKYINFMRNEMSKGFVGKFKHFLIK